MLSKKETTDELLTRGVGDFIDPDNLFKKKLEENPTKIVIKFGVDPTRPDLHLGHAVILKKLRKFQDLGCMVVFLIGDLTARIGDPTGNSKIRPEVDQKEIEVNMKTYLDQVGRILITDDKTKFSWIRNSDWFVSINDIIAPDKSKLNIESEGKKISMDLPGNHILAKAYFWTETRMQKNRINNYSFLNILSVLRRITLSRLVERDMFQERIKSGLPVFLHEIMYPILQGIDSNAISEIYGSCDLEVGGTDQTFNMLMARDIMQINGKKPQSVLAFELLEGTDGKEKMSKSLDNYISIIDSPNEMFGKVMSIPDDLIIRYFELCTYRPIPEIEKIKKNLKQKTNPRDIKIELAFEITSMYHGEKEGEKAKSNFLNVFSQGQIPKDITEIKCEATSNIGDELIKAKIITSKSEYKRLVQSGSIERMEEKQKILNHEESVQKTSVFRVGKKRFIKLVVV